jgi:hypothetical protein
VLLEIILGRRHLELGVGAVPIERQVRRAAAAFLPLRPVPLVRQGMFERRPATPGGKPTQSRPVAQRQLVGKRTRSRSLRVYSPCERSAPGLRGDGPGSGATRRTKTLVPPHGARMPIRGARK